MPRRYVAESFMDRIAASKVYEGSKYTDASALNYINRSNDPNLMHPETYRQMLFLLEYLAEQGEQTVFDYIKDSFLRGEPLPWEENMEE